MKRLLEDYQSYVDNMNDWKGYVVDLIDCDGKVVQSTSMIALNRNHLLIELSQMYKLEEMNIVSIDIREKVQHH